MSYPVVKLLVLVNSAPEFAEQHLVAKGASDLLVEMFGEERAAMPDRRSGWQRCHLASRSRSRVSSRSTRSLAVAGGGPARWGACSNLEIAYEL